MLKDPALPWQISNPEDFGRRLSRLGWIGFWLQLALLTAPVLLLVYVLFIATPESAQRRGIDLSNYLSFGSLFVMLFTTFWFFRYTRLARRMVDPELRPPQSTVVKTLWIGVWAGCLGILFSLLVMMNSAFRLLFVLLTMPQTGIPFAAAGGGDPVQTLSAIDGISLTSLVFVLTAEFIVLGFSLWLLFRLTRPSAQIAEAVSDDQEADTQA